MAKCLECNTEVDVISEDEEGTNYYQPCDEIINAIRFNVPFYCTICGAIKFPWRAIRDIVFIYPLPVEETYREGGLVVIPDTYKEFYKKGQGVILSIGPGYYDDKKFHPIDPDLKIGELVIYNKDVPWYDVVIGNDKKEHVVVMCGAKDIWIIQEM